MLRVDALDRPTRIILDCHIWDKHLEPDKPTLLALQERVLAGTVEVLIPPILRHELSESPYGGVPDFFPVRLVAEEVLVAGYGIAGLAKVGDGKFFEAHRGESNSTEDAMIATTAEFECDFLVSNDPRFRKRRKIVDHRCQLLCYAEFVEWLRPNTGIRHGGT